MDWCSCKWLLGGMAVAILGMAWAIRYLFVCYRKEAQARNRDKDKYLSMLEPK